MIKTFKLNGKSIVSTSAQSILLSFSTHQVNIGWPLYLTDPLSILQTVLFPGETYYEDPRQILMTLLFCITSLKIKKLKDTKSYYYDQNCESINMKDGAQRYTCVRDQSNLVRGFTLRNPNKLNKSTATTMFIIKHLEKISGFLQCHETAKHKSPYEQFVGQICQTYSNKYIMFTYELGYILEDNYLQDNLMIEVTVDWNKMDPNGVLYRDYSFKAITEIVKNIEANMMYEFKKCKKLIYDCVYDDEQEVIDLVLNDEIIVERGDYIVDVEFIFSEENQNHYTLYVNNIEVGNASYKEPVFTFKVKNPTPGNINLTMDHYNTTGLEQIICLYHLL